MADSSPQVGDTKVGAQGNELEFNENHRWERKDGEESPKTEESPKEAPKEESKPDKYDGVIELGETAEATINNKNNKGKRRYNPDKSQWEDVVQEEAPKEEAQPEAEPEEAHTDAPEESPAEEEPEKTSDISDIKNKKKPTPSDKPKKGLGASIKRKLMAYARFRPKTLAGQLLKGALETTGEELKEICSKLDGVSAKYIAQGYDDALELFDSVAKGYDLANITDAELEELRNKLYQATAQRYKEYGGAEAFQGKTDIITRKRKMELRTCVELYSKLEVRKKLNGMQ